MTKKTEHKADRSKRYVASHDGMIEGRPVAKGSHVDLSKATDERFQDYLDAGLIELEDQEDTADVDKVLDEAAAKIDTTDDRRTEKR